MEKKEQHKNIYKNSIEIPLHGFEYLHHTHGDGDGGPKVFFGREKELSRIFNILNSRKSARGAYLITGYRGSGKTSFINEAINRYKKSLDGKYLFKKNRVYVVKLNLSNDSSLDAFQIYKRMAKGLLDEVSQYRNSIRGYLRKKIGYILSVVAPFIIIPIVHLFLKGGIESSFSDLILFPSVMNKGVFDLFDFSVFVSAYPLYIFYVFFIYLYINYVRSHYNKNNAYGALKILINNIENENKSTYGFKAGLERSGNISYSRDINRICMTTADIEYELNQILNNNIHKNSDVIFVFDELDKITDTDRYQHKEIDESFISKREKLDVLLGNLKNIISENPARFIFIGGRDMHDAYLSQSGAVSSLYQSLFNDSIYIPSLLSDGTDRQLFRINSMIERLCVAFILPTSSGFYDGKIDYSNLKIQNYSKTMVKWKSDWNKCSRMKGCSLSDDEKNYTLDSLFILRNFIHYLTFKSKGNYKVFLSIFDSFIRYKKDKLVNLDHKTPDYIKCAGVMDSGNEAKYSLVFEIKDIQKVLLTSNLYISFHYHLSRRLRHADDKIVITSLSMLQFIIKFYNMGFSRRQLYNMYEVVNTNRPPELKGITEILLKNVLTSSLRKSRYCITRYRFTSLFENEVRYVSETSPDQSASHNFSLDSLNYIKTQYLKDIVTSESVMGACSSRKALYFLSLGDFYYWEQSYDEAINAYLSGSELLRDTDTHIVYSQTYLESMLKLGLIFEIKHNYSEAKNIYLQASKDASFFYHVNKDSHTHKYRGRDAKLDYLAQPYWAWLFLNIKRSPKIFDEDLPFPDYIKSMYRNNMEVKFYKIGLFYFYVNDFERASEFLEKSIKEIYSNYGGFEFIKSIDSFNERNAFLVGKSMCLIEFSRVINIINGFFENVRKSKEDIGKYSKKILRSIINVSSIKIDHINDVKSIAGVMKEFSDPKIENILVKSICNLLIANRIFQASGLNSHAVNANLSIVIIWGLFLEALPLRLIDFRKNISNCDLDLLYKASATIDYICDVSYAESIKNHQKSFAEFINNHFSVDLEPLISSGNIDMPLYALDSEKNPISILRLLLENGDIEDMPRVYWQRSMQGQYIAEMYLWQKRAFNKVSQEKTESKGARDLSINSFPQFGVRSFSLVLVLSGRNKLGNLKEKSLSYSNYEKSRIDELYELAGQSVFYFYRATLYISQSSGNEQDITFPTQSLVYYNLWEILYEILMFHYKNIGDIVSYLSGERCGNTLCGEVRNLVNRDSGEVTSSSSADNLIKCLISCCNELSRQHLIEGTVDGERKIKEFSGHFQVNLIQYVQNKIYEHTETVFRSSDDMSNVDSEVPYSMCDINRMESLSRKYLSKTAESLDAHSKSHQDVLFEKYYLNDDYDDPTFMSDIFFYKAFAEPARLHEKSIDMGMKDLKKESRKLMKRFL